MRQPPLEGGSDGNRSRRCLRQCDGASQACLRVAQARCPRRKCPADRQLNSGRDQHHPHLLEVPQLFLQGGRVASILGTPRPFSVLSVCTRAWDGFQWNLLGCSAAGVFRMAAPALSEVPPAALLVRPLVPWCRELSLACASPTHSPLLRASSSAMLAAPSPRTAGRAPPLMQAWAAAPRQQRPWLLATLALVLATVCMHARTAPEVTR